MKRLTIKESYESKIPYDLVSSFVILRDHINLDDDNYINSEHRDLVDIADTLYNADVSIDDIMPEYKDLYIKYGKQYFDKVLDDIYAIDTQVNYNNINDFIAEVNDKLNYFDSEIE